jgi:hypothetical protein
MPTALDIESIAARSLGATLRSHDFDAEHLDKLVDVPRGTRAAGGIALLAHRCDGGHPRSGTRTARMSRTRDQVKPAFSVRVKPVR